MPMSTSNIARKAKTVCLLLSFHFIVVTRTLQSSSTHTSMDLGHCRALGYRTSLSLARALLIPRPRTTHLRRSAKACKISRS